MKLLNNVKFKNFIRGNYFLNGIAELCLTGRALIRGCTGGGVF